MSATVQELATALNAQLRGEPHSPITSVAAIATASHHDIVYCESEKYLQDALASQAGAVIAGEFATSVETRKPMLIVKQPRLAFAMACRHLRTPRKRGGFVHKTAIIPPTAVFGEEVLIGAYVVIGEHASIGDRVCIGAGASIGHNVIVGHDSHIHARVSVYGNSMIGSHTLIHSGAVLGADGFGYVRDEETGRYYQMPQIGRLIIGDHVEIGANCTLDRGGLEDTVIGSGSKIDNLVHIGHNVTIGENVVIAAQTGISGSCAIGDGAVIGGQVGVGEHVQIEGGVILGGQSGVLSNKVLRGKGVVHFGTPARPVQQFMKEQATLSQISRERE